MPTLRDIALTVSQVWGLNTSAFDAIWSRLIATPPGIPDPKEYQGRTNALAGIGTQTEPALIAIKIIFEAGKGLPSPTTIHNLLSEAVRIGTQAGHKPTVTQIEIVLRKLPPETAIAKEPDNPPQEPIIATVHRHDLDQPQGLTQAGVQDQLKQLPEIRIFIVHRRGGQPMIGEVYLNGKPLHEPAPKNAYGEPTFIDFTRFQILRYVLLNHRSARTWIPDIIEHCFGREQQPKEDLRALYKEDRTGFYLATAEYRNAIGELSKILQREIQVQLTTERKKLYRLIPRCSYCVLEVD